LIPSVNGSFLSDSIHSLTTAIAYSASPESYNPHTGRFLIFLKIMINILAHAKRSGKNLDFPAFFDYLPPFINKKHDF